MKNINVNDFKKRKLDICYVVVYVLSRDIEVAVDEVIQVRKLYTLIGITTSGGRRIIGIYLDKLNDNHFWIDKFEDIKSRGCETILFVSTLPNKYIEKAIKLIYNESVIVPSICFTIESVNKFFSDSYSSTIPKEIKRLFNCSSIQSFELEYNMFLEKYSSNALLAIVINNSIASIREIYNFSYNIRIVLFNYYFLRDYDKYFKKVLGSLDYSYSQDDITAAMINHIKYLEQFGSFTKLEWRNILNDLYCIFNDKIVKYL